jgi:hypothetical protein
MDNARRRSTWPLALPLALVVASFSALSTAVGCEVGTVPTVDCTTASVKTYAQLKGSVMAYCTDCHGASRADHGVRYDTYSAAVAAATSGARTIADGSMPEEIEMPDAAAQEFYAWAQCGTPE